MNVGYPATHLSLVPVSLYLLPHPLHLTSLPPPPHRVRAPTSTRQKYPVALYRRTRARRTYRVSAHLTLKEKHLSHYYLYCRSHEYQQPTHIFPTSKRWKICYCHLHRLMTVLGNYYLQKICMSLFRYFFNLLSLRMFPSV